MRWVPARVRGTTGYQGYPSLKLSLQVVAGTAAMCCIVLAPYHKASSNSSFHSHGTFQDHWQGVCQPIGDSVILLSLGCPGPLGSKSCSALWHRQKHPLTSCLPARPKLASHACVPGRRATIVSQNSIIVLHKPYLIRERKMGL